MFDSPFFLFFSYVGRGGQFPSAPWIPTMNRIIRNLKLVYFFRIVCSPRIFIIFSLECFQFFSTHFYKRSYAASFFCLYSKGLGNTFIDFNTFQLYIIDEVINIAHTRSILLMTCGSSILLTIILIVYGAL